MRQRAALQSCAGPAIDEPFGGSEGHASRWLRLFRGVFFIVGCAIVLAVIAPLARGLPGLWKELAAGVLGSVGAFALTALFTRWERLRLGNVGAAPGRGSLPRLAVGFLIGLALFALWESTLAAFIHLRWVRAPATGAASLILALAAYLSLAGREELSFRGYPLRRWAQPFGLWGAQFLVALAFAAEHRVGGQPWLSALAGAGTGSLLFGMAAIATRGLALPIGLHAAWNFGDWLLGGKSSAGLWKPILEQRYKETAQLAGTISYLGVMTAAILAFWWWHRRRKIP